MGISGPAEDCVAVGALDIPRGRFLAGEIVSATLWRVSESSGEGAPGGPGMRRRTIVGVCAAVAAVLTVASVATERGLPRYLKLRAEAQALADKNALIAADNARLTRQIRALRDDANAVRRVAREDLGMVARDEVVFTFE